MAGIEDEHRVTLRLRELRAMPCDCPDDPHGNNPAIQYGDPCPRCLELESVKAELLRFREAERLRRPDNSAMWAIYGW